MTAAHPFGGLLGHPMPKLQVKGSVHWCDGHPPTQDVKERPVCPAPEPRTYVGRPRKEPESPEQDRQRRQWREAYLRRRAAAIALKRRARDRRLAELGQGGVDIDRIHHTHHQPKGQS